jgi:SAM-dependent methyltransferase
MEEAGRMTHARTPAPPATAGYGAVLGRAFSRRYEQGRDSWTEEPAMRRVVDVLLAELPSTASRVLDVGAGRGRDTEALLLAGHQVTAVDLVAFAEWEELAVRHGARLRVLSGDVRDLELGRDFDAVLDNGCLHHQHPHDYAAYLRILRGALRPGGVLVVSLFLLPSDVAEGVLHVEDDGRLAREFTDREAVELLEANGFALTGALRIPRRTGRAYLVVVARRRDG